jgi:hypothetical protein
MTQNGAFTKTSGNSKARLIAYWIITGILSLVFLNGGINDFLKQDPYYGLLLKMGYPGYFSVILGVWKTLGIIAILIPGFKLLKEWAYAGYFFLLSGAVISHLQIGDHIIFQLIILVLLILSWYLRPESRRVITFKKSVVS